MSEATIPIKELMEKTEQWLLGQGYKKSTLGFYRATWNRFLSYSASPAYSRETAEQFLLQYFGVDVHAIDQTLDGRMRHARRHMNALDEIFRTGTVCRRKVYGVASIDDDCFDKFFSDYLSYCKMQNFSRSWMDNTIAALRLFFQPLGEHNNFNPEFHKYLRRAGIAIPTKRHTGVHTIRHSFATNMLRKGTPVQDVSQILGHSNISVTETYLRVDIEHMRLCSLSLEGLHLQTVRKSLRWQGMIHNAPRLLCRVPRKMPNIRHFSPAARGACWERNWTPRF